MFDGSRFFDDVIQEFEKPYKAYKVIDKKINAAGEEKYIYKIKNVRLALQTNGRSYKNSEKGAILEQAYIGYALAKYLLNEGDYILDKSGNVLVITGLDPWEEDGGYRKYDLIRTTMAERIKLESNKITEDDERVINDTTCSKCHHSPCECKKEDYYL
jgi:hypothetical protein